MNHNAPRNPGLGRRLAGRLIAVSVSEIPDLPQLGLPSNQADRVLEAILTPLVSEGAKVAYGGRVEHPHNFTVIISNVLGETYRRLEVAPGARPYVHYVAEHRLLNTPPGVLAEHLATLAPYGEAWVTTAKGVGCKLTCVEKRQTAMQFAIQDSSGSQLQIVDSTQALFDISLAMLAAPETDARQSFTHMRSEMANACDARIAVGGRQSGFLGAMSGVCQEALLTIEAAKPLLVLGGFGGSARDIAIALGLLDPAAAVPRSPARDADRYERGLQALVAQQQRFAAAFPDDKISLLKDLAATDSLPGATDLLLRILMPMLSK